MIGHQVCCNNLMVTSSDNQPAQTKHQKSHRRPTTMTNPQSDAATFRGQLKAVVFDWAGTIIDYGSQAPALAVTEVFRRFEVPITIEQARVPMGLAKRDHLRAILDFPETSDRWNSAHGRQPSNSDVDEIYRRFLPIQKEMLAQHAELVPGCLELISECRARNLRVGSTTGYTRELMNIVALLAKQRGLELDAIVCADEVPAGRPAPWMCLENARILNVYPPSAVVVVDDTVVGIEAGLNAGMWSVGVVQSGNLVGLSADEFHKLDSSSKVATSSAAHNQLRTAGAHFTVETVADLLPVLIQIDERLHAGQRP